VTGDRVLLERLGANRVGHGVRPVQDPHMLELMADLNTHPGLIEDVVLLAPDLEASKDFYANKVGLRILSDTPDAVTFQCGGESHMVISKSAVGTKDEQTQAVFRVKDLRGEVAELRRRGVKIEEYDIPGVKTVDGIADMGFAMAAWFIDPGRNCVGMIQIK